MSCTLTLTGDNTVPKPFPPGHFVVATRKTLAAIAAQCLPEFSVATVDSPAAMAVIKRYGGESGANQVMMALDGLQTAIVGFPDNVLPELRQALCLLDFDGECGPQCEAIAVLLDTPLTE